MTHATSTSRPSLAQAVMGIQAGDLNRSRQIITKILADQPDNFDALHLLGVIHAVNGAHDAAELSYRKALRINGNHEELRVNLTHSLVAVGKFEEALFNIERALLLNGHNAVAHFTRANILRALKRRDEALASFDAALAINPGYAKAWTNRGATLGELKHCDEALAHYDRALGINPGSVEAWSNRGIALSELKRYDEALASYDKALGINRGAAEAWSNRGNALGELKRYDEALASFGKALGIDPRSAEAWSNRGNVLGELKRYDEALASFDRALGIDPRHAEARYNRGIALSELKRFDEALACFEQALAIDSDLEYCLGNWLHTKMMVCNWSGIEGACAKLPAEIERGFPALDPFASLAAPISARLQRKCAETYVGDKYGHLASGAPDFARHEGGKIRVGYFSSDFKAHAVSFLTVGMFEAHDRDRFEIYGFGLDRAETDATRRRVVDAFDHFIDLSARDTLEAIDIVRKIGLDIAVDLNGHTSGARTEIFGARVAPVQINYIGHPGTMGAGFVDYIIGDRIVIPEHHRAHYAEKIVYLPDTFQVNDSKRSLSAPLSRNQLGLDDASFVFCCFNNSYKLTPAYFHSWLRLLGKIDNSVLWLIKKSDSQVASLKSLAERSGVSRDRIVFSEPVPYAEHLARYQAADLALDTSPFGGGATTSDALWSGVPVVTALGNTFAGRMSASLLSAVGLPELVAGSLGEYEALAFELATSPQKLSSIKEKLVRDRSTCPLFDTARFTKHIEDAYSRMREKIRAGLPPEHIYVEARSQAAPSP